MLSLFNCIFGRFKQLRAMACLVVARCLRLRVAHGAGLRRVACRASRHAPLHHAARLVCFVYICCMAMPCGPFCVPIRAVSPCQTARIGIQPRPFRGAVLQQCKWLAARMLACRILCAKHVYTFCTAVALPWGVLPDCGHSYQASGGGAARPGHKAMCMAAASPGVLHNASMTRQRPRSQRQSMCMEAGCQSFGITMAISKQTLLDIVAGW